MFSRFTLRGDNSTATSKDSSSSGGAGGASSPAPQFPTLEVEITDFSKKLKKCLNADDDDAAAFFSTPPITVFGVCDCVLSFYPKGDFWCQKKGFCSLTLITPANVDMKLKMYIGRVTREPVILEELEESNERVWGLHEFCELDEASIASDDNGVVVVGVEFEAINWTNPKDKESDKVVRLSL